MNVPFLLLLILFVVMYAVGGTKGAKSFLTLLLNVLVLFILFVLIVLGLEPVWSTVVGCTAISAITLFTINGVQKKTVAAFLSVLLVVLATIALTYPIGMRAHLQGFGKEQAESIEFLSIYVHLDFSKIVVCEILMGLLGAIIDVSISVSSSMSEIFRSNPEIAKASLMKSGMEIGRDILGTMSNTLLFAYIAGFMTLLIWFHDLHYKTGDILNAKVFCAEIFQTVTSGIGIILIIPVTAAVTCGFLYAKRKGQL